MSRIAEYTGYVVMALGLIATLCGLGWLTMELVWKTYRSARQFAWVTRAVQHYKNIEPPPYEAKP